LIFNDLEAKRGGVGGRPKARGEGIILEKGCAVMGPRGGREKQGREKVKGR